MSNIVNELRDTYGDNITSGDVRGYCAAQGVSYPTVTRRLEQYKIGRGKWDLTITEELEKTFASPSVIPPVEQNLIPQKDNAFIKFGNFTDLKKIIKSSLFYPTFITGLSGNGKTFGVEQACAQLGRELIRVNITIETDEDDLIGVSALLMVPPFGTTAQSLKLYNGGVSCSLTRSILPVTKSSVSNRSLRVLEFSLKKSEDTSDQQEDSTSLQPQILRAKVQTTDGLLELTCLMKPSSNDSQ